jgi:glycosyltransferase involved in cell wall biosynthesis
MRKLFYMGLESYEARYTLQLQEWNERVFKRRGIDYQVITGQELDNSKAIVTGSVLDAHGRSYYSLSQTMNLVQMMKNGELTSEDVIFYEDMFTPGIECLPYIMDQSPLEYRPKVFLRFLAQTTDPDDFLIREGMFHWMRKYEEMCDHVVSGICVASEEFAAHLRIAGLLAPIYVTGLPYGKEEVRGRIDSNIPLNQRKKRVAFAARWDDEKQPDFYMDLAEAYYKIDPEVEFAVFCGHPELKSNNQSYVERAQTLANHTNRFGTANFSVYTGLKKDDYYNLLADSRVLFNCALQDWVSNTVSEADTFGTLTLFPAYRSFPEVFANNHNHLYVPWSVDDAVEKLKRMFAAIDNNDVSAYNIGKISDYQNGTIDRTLDVLEGKGEQWGRNDWDFRKHVAKAKYE